MNKIFFISGVQPSDSALHRQASTLLPNLFLFRLLHCRILSRVPGAMQ